MSAFTEAVKRADEATRRTFGTTATHTSAGGVEQTLTVILDQTEEAESDVPGVIPRALSFADDVSEQKPKTGEHLVIDFVRYMIIATEPDPENGLWLILQKVSSG